MEDAVLYVTAQGARLSRVGERLLVRGSDGRILSDIPFFRLIQVVCFGSVEISGAALTVLMRRNIDVAFLTVDGRFKCRLSNLQPRAVVCRMRQYERQTDQAFRVRLAKAFVKGKILNSRTWLMRQNRTREDSVSKQVVGIRTCLDLLERAVGVEEILGLEGTGARYHFEAYRLLLKQDLGFAGRVRRPPTDPVNAMLSFGYTLLFNRVQAAVEQAGLDPALANLHSPEDRRASLALDLMEEFRPILVDSVVAGLVNRMDVGPGDFFRIPEKGVRMSEQAIGRLVKAFQNRLADEYSHPIEGRSFPFRDLLVRQAWQYKSVVLGEREEYQPIVTR